MNDIQKIDKTTDLAISQPGTCRAIDVRCQIINVPEVINALTPIERRMFEASIKTPVADISEEELTYKVGLIAKYITRDAGIKKVDDYDIARFMNVLKSYYSLLSLQEIRMAFELAMTGGLDEYLPRDKDGNPDKNHYQTFNIEYITKILNAYKKCRRETEYKAYTALPRQTNNISEETKAHYKRAWKKTFMNSFLRYKYRGELPDNVNFFLLYSEIKKVGLAEPINVTEADRKEAVSRMLKKTHTGVIKEFIAECIRRQQTNNSDVISEAGLIAMEKALVRSFDEIIKEEIQITDYITLD